MIPKKSYLQKVSTIIKPKKPHNNELEECNLDLAKAQRPTTKSKKPTIGQMYIKKDIFDWGPR